MIEEGGYTESDSKRNKVVSPEPEEKQIPMEKILTISATEYCESIGAKVSDYIFKGIKGEFGKLSSPDNVEVVVGYCGLTRQYDPSGYGTAMIRKPKTQLEQDVE